MVYVDDMELPFGKMIMCHMIADTHEELMAMADAIEVDRIWLQDAGTKREHFDISKTKKAIAIIYGAKEIGMRDLVKITDSKHLECDHPFPELKNKILRL